MTSKAPIRHGTVDGYTNRGCRCGECCRVHTDYNRAARAARISKPLPDHVPHGSTSTYSNWACRCDECRAANAAASRARQARRKAQGAQW